MKSEFLVTNLPLLLGSPSWVTTCPSLLPINRYFLVRDLLLDVFLIPGAIQSMPQTWNRALKEVASISLSDPNRRSQMMALLSSPSVQPSSGS